MMEKNKLKNIVECLLYVSGKPITEKKISDVIEGAQSKEIVEVIKELAEEYDTTDKPVFLPIPA